MEQHPVVLFDGVCNFCSGAVNFVIRQDKQKKLRFATLQSAAGQRLLQAYKLPTQNFDSFVFIEKDKAYHSSTAGLKLYNHLPWYWKWTQLFWLVPRVVRDGLYKLVARNRYKWFGKKESCMVPTPDLRSRFLE